MKAPIEAWLDALGLGCYAEAFVRDDIDLETLPELTETDLEALGLSLGHRKRLLGAIAKLAAGPGQSSDTAGDATTSWSRQPGERKLVTLLFADITGSTSVTESLDAEDAHERLYGAVQHMCAAVEHHGGTICRFMGDGVMAMFGAPLAFEDHAAQACRAALALQQDVAEYANRLQRQHGCRIEVRVGVHSGEVVVLRVGSADKDEFDASGPNVALAARMEQTAEPGSVQLTASTYALVERHFEAAPLAAVTAKGFSEPVAVLRLLRERATEAISDSATFVGRRAELDQWRALLASCLDEASGRCVVLRGEPGIGKSFLAEQLAAAARDRGFRVHRSRALDFGWARGQDAARLLVRDILGLGSGTSQTQRAAAAERAIEDGLVEDEMRVHLLDLLDLPPAPELEAAYAALPAMHRAEERQQLLARLVTRSAERTPRLLLVEDVHWAGDAVRAYLAAIGRVLPNCPAIMVLTTRPEAHSAHGGWDHLLGDVPLTMLGIGPLSPREATAFAHSLGIDDPDLVEQCSERSGRNPLFLEQLLRAWLEGGSDELPGSIQTLVASQVDRLSELDKRAVQAAAVLGKHFELAALRSVIDVPNYDCDELAARRLVRDEGAELAFHHALVQESVLSSLLRRDRRAFHAAAARWFAGRDAVLRARHLDLADDDDAPPAYLEAARAEMASHRFVSASELVGRGLALAHGDDVGFALQSMRGEVLAALGSTVDAANAYRAAAELSDDPAARCRALLGAAQALRIIGRYDEALALLGEAKTLAGDDEELYGERSRIHYVRGLIRFVQTDGARCEQDQRRAYELAKACGDPELEARALTGLVRSCYLNHRWSSAAEHTRAYVALCDRHGLEHVKYAQIHMLGVTLYLELRIDEAMECFRASREHAPRLGEPRQAIVGATEGANALADAGRTSEAAEFARAAIEQSQRVGERRFEPEARALLLRAEELSSNPQGVERELRALWARLDDGERRFSGWWVIGTLMLAAGDAATRRWVEAEARALPATRSYGLGCLRFLHDAIAASLRAGETARAGAFAEWLSRSTEEALCPLSALHVRWARASETADAAALRAVHDDASRAGLVPLTAIMDAQRAAAVE